MAPVSELYTRYKFLFGSFRILYGILFHCKSKNGVPLLSLQAKHLPSAES